jgi:putative tryptophan/tyrosine transport system substrate-binding protein
MHRRTFVIGGLAGVAWPGIALAQTKLWRVGYLSMASPDADRHWVAAFREGLKERGYVEGKNLVLDQRHAYNQPARVPDLAAGLVRAKVAVMVVYGSAAVAAVRKSAPGIPVVMTVHADPVGSGIVPSLARPGGNITGFTDGHADLAPKRLEILKEIVPSVSRVAAFYNPDIAHGARQWKLVQGAAPRLGITLVGVEIRRPEDIERAFAETTKRRAGAIFMIPDPTWWVGQERRIASLAIEHKLASIGTVREFAEHGMLAAYGTNFAELWRRSAGYVDRILKGARPGELPIEHPRKFDLVINLKTAKALGITVPRRVVMRADRVIE